MRQKTPPDPIKLYSETASDPLVLRLGPSHTLPVEAQQRLYCRQRLLVDNMRQKETIGLYLAGDFVFGNGTNFCGARRSRYPTATAKARQRLHHGQRLGLWQNKFIQFCWVTSCQKVASVPVGQMVRQPLLVSSTRQSNCFGYDQVTKFQKRHRIW